MTMRCTGSVIVAVLLVGCVPLPLASGDLDTSRRNVGDSLPDFIVAGRTTRADVLLALGEPDMVSEHGAWISYNRATRDSGAAYVFPYGSGAVYFTESVTYRRLIVYFDEQGAVIDAHADRTTCSESEIGQQRTRSCVIQSEQNLQRAAVQPSTVSSEDTIFAPAQWHRDVRGFDKVRALTAEPAAIAGRLVVGRTTLSFYRPDADSRSQPLVEFAYSEIREIALDSFGSGRRLVVQRKNGAADSFTVLRDESRVDAPATAGAAELTKTRWSAAGGR